MLGRLGSKQLVVSCRAGCSRSAAVALRRCASSSARTLSATSIVVAPSEPCSEGCRFRVLFVQRSLTSSFMPGAYVFPGGVVEADDSAEEWQGLAGCDTHAVSRDMCDPARICAVRETFEESGCLLLGGHGANLDSQLSKWRVECSHDPTVFRTFVRECFRPDPASHHPPPLAAGLSKLYLWSNFVTPDFEVKSFDARFFLYIARSSSELVLPTHGAQHDERETIDTAWLSPRQVLSEVSKGELFMPPPQWYLMDEIAEFETVEDLEAAAQDRARQGVEPTQPHLVSATDSEGNAVQNPRLGTACSLVLALPGDEDHHEAAGAVGDRRRILVTPSPQSGFPTYNLQVGVAP